MASMFLWFPDLPLEIQTMIWEQAALLPRVVEITFQPEQMFRAPPALLSTCHESRRISLPVYRKSTLSYYGSTTYFNYEKDTLYFLDKHCVERRDKLSNRRLHDVLWDISTFFCYCKTTRQLRHVAFPKLPFYADLSYYTWETSRPIDHEDACARTMSGFMRGEHFIGDIPEWYPSITLVSKDPIVEEEDSTFLNYGPIRDFKTVQKVDDSVRQFCHCWRSWVRWDAQRLFTSNDDLRDLGIPIPDRTRSPCQSCSATFDLDLRIATIERPYLKSPFTWKESTPEVAAQEPLSDREANGVRISGCDEPDPSSTRIIAKRPKHVSASSLEEPRRPSLFSRLWESKFNPFRRDNFQIAI
ncbi:hypothetical protein EG329_004164 [Mollisiaceae sp. DMI_Dod_QoI]|nr:hypothetical protein EG329_004164 [Helotiales sp. DMI_Dod_QoI]